VLTGTVSLRGRAPIAESTTSWDTIPDTASARPIGEQSIGELTFSCIGTASGRASGICSGSRSLAICSGSGSLATITGVPVRGRVLR
jgi:hypothetical protein